MSPTSDRSAPPPAEEPEGPERSGAVRRFSTPLRGHAFAGPVPPDALGAGRAASLVREPDNPADPLAVAVWVSDDQRRAWRLGYLDRTVAARLAPRIDAGSAVEAVLDGWVEEPGGRWERPLVRVTVAAEPEHSRGPESVQATVWGRPPGVRRRAVNPPAPGGAGRRPEGPGGAEGRPEGHGGA